MFGAYPPGKSPHRDGTGRRHTATQSWNPTRDFLRGRRAAPPPARTLWCLGAAEVSSYWKEDYEYFDQTFPVSGGMERLVPGF